MHLEGGVGPAGNNIMGVKRQLLKATRAAAHEAMTAASEGKYISLNTFIKYIWHFKSFFPFK